MKFTLNNEQIFDIIKWFIGSVVLVIITIIIESGFRERETGIEEMKIYNEYVDIILRADNIEERWKLAEYFATVTPTERLRSRWVNYQKIISKDYEKFKKLSDDESIVISDTIFNPEKLVVIQNKKYEIGKSLITNNNLELALKYEKLGFESLIVKDIESAIRNFKESENYYKGFHQVYEIYLYLLRNKSLVAIENDSNWGKIYEDILNKYSWKMPEEYKNKLK